MDDSDMGKLSMRSGRIGAGQGAGPGCIGLNERAYCFGVPLSMVQDRSLMGSAL